MLSQKAAKDDISLVEYVIGYLFESRQITEEELHTFHPAVCNRLDRNHKRDCSCRQDTGGTSRN